MMQDTTASNPSMVEPSATSGSKADYAPPTLLVLGALGAKTHWNVFTHTLS